jgi:hypothetical protein
LRAGQEVLFVRAAGVAKMDVRIDQTRQHKTPAGFNHLFLLLGHQVFGKRDDFLAGCTNIQAHSSLRQHDQPMTYQHTTLQWTSIIDIRSMI